MKLSVKLFLENENEYVLGPGRVELLRFVEELGSLRKAAQKLGMSYRWAWGRINDMEKALGVFLLAQDPASGGKAKTLTAEARELLTWYNAIEKEMEGVFAKASAKCPGFLGSSANGSH
ncbi:MAG: LysR family transcriptional regulator [Desulfovibrionaceae bacterium]|nr:LysR family transcriptional regulator [Desulfovibrionaceae bacterium]